jgi:phosphatidylserine decarboxylase
MFEPACPLPLTDYPAVLLAHGAGGRLMHQLLEQLIWPALGGPAPAAQHDAAVLAPADGRIVKVEQAHDAHTQREALLISVFMNVFNVHSNRSPVDGRVESVAHLPGRFINADLDKASTENERNAMVMRLDSGERIAVVQVAGLIARRILCYVKAGDRLTRGQRYGFIRFGSRVDVYLPLGARPRVAVGDIVHATTTVLAEL